MIKIIALVVLAAVVALLAYASTRPDSFRVERRIHIQAPADKVARLIADFNQWSKWSPWEKLDPDMKRTRSGAPSGPGAVYAWEGNSKVGAGRMEIMQAKAELVVVKLDFLKPFEAHNTAEFTLQANGDQTQVTWAMFGPSPFISKLMGIFFSMDGMIGKDFEAGLANLKQAAEQ